MNEGVSQGLTTAHMDFDILKVFFTGVFRRFPGRVGFVLVRCYPSHEGHLVCGLRGGSERDIYLIIIGDRGGITGGHEAVTLNHLVVTSDDPWRSLVITS